MKKFKIYMTIFILYEFAVLTVLQIPKYCASFFNAQFCNMSFKYFLVCIVVPGLFFLIAWWLPDISKRLCGNCQCDKAEIQKKNNPQILNKEDIEHLITGAVVVGIKKFISTHPKTIKTFSDVMDAFINSGEQKKSKK